VKQEITLNYKIYFNLGCQLIKIFDQLPSTDLIIHPLGNFMSEPEKAELGFSSLALSQVLK
jgi:hypothetical protein